MPSTEMEWPAWAEYTAVGPTEAKDPEFLAIKKEIIAEYGEAALRKSWLATCEALQAVTDEIAAKGHRIMPVLNAETILRDGLSEAEQAEMKRIGSFIVRGVVSEEETTALYRELKAYVGDEANRDRIKGWPAESPSMLILYSTPAQTALRSHPNHLRLQRLLNGLWHDASPAQQTSPEPLVYYDGLRDRAPHQAFLGLGPHIDAGSFCRWADPAYRRAYHHIFSGEPDRHDCYDLSLRVDAVQDRYKSTAHSSVFRSFQGWTALTPTAPGEGTILLYPNVQAAIAYILLRPFFRPPADPADVLDAAKWTFDPDNGWFPGSFKLESQRLSRTSHPHLRLEECLLHVPRIRPGDSVWWHTDTCHAVDPEHRGTNNASVAFIAACPTTPNNKAYVKEQLACTLAGKPPPDYQRAVNLDERTLKGYVGLDGLSDEAKKAFGFGL